MKPYGCYACDARGCERCNDSGFVVKDGGKLRGLSQDELTAPMRNWRYRS